MIGASASSATEISELASADFVGGTSELVKPVETNGFNGVQVIYDSCREFVADDIPEAV